ncbi:MAG: hypothetical protein LUI12_03650 [Clostridiales bacterium]|nr:hypothetical protein [Clostridiales bacterium]
MSRKSGKITSEFQAEPFGRLNGLQNCGRYRTWTKEAVGADGIPPLSETISIPAEGMQAETGG